MSFGLHKKAMADIGTPENPEIIEPGQAPRQASSRPAPGRWTLFAQLLRVLVAVSLPAIAIDLIFGWMFHTAVNFGGVLPWLGLVVMAPPALILTLVALAANLILWPVLILILSGRAVANPLNDARFDRFRFVTNVRR